MLSDVKAILDGRGQFSTPIRKNGAERYRGRDSWGYDDFDLWLCSAGEYSRTVASTFSESIFTPVLMSTLAGASEPSSLARVPGFQKSINDLEGKLGVVAFERDWRPALVH